MAAKKRVSIKRPSREDLLANNGGGSFKRIKPDKKFDDEAKRLFLETYAQTGLVMYSAAVAGVHDSTVRRHKMDDEWFAEAYEVARKWHCESLEAEIKRRAVTGWEEPVYQKGERVMEPKFDPDTGQPMMDEKGDPIMVPAVTRRFSDRLLEMSAKRHMPEYREKQEVDVNITGGVLAIPMVGSNEDKPPTAEDWESKYGGETVEADFERVAPEPDAPLAELPETPEHQEPCVAVECHICRPTDDEPKQPKDTRRIKRGY